MSAEPVSWGLEDAPGLITQLVTAQTNQRLAELTLFARTVRQKADARCQQAMEDAMRVARTLPPGALAAALSEPEFHYWTYIAECLRGRLVHDEPIPPADIPHLAGVPDYAKAPLLTHILDLNRFLLSASLMAGVDIRCGLPVHDNALVIPGLGILIDLETSAPTVTVAAAWQEDCQLILDGQVLPGFAEALGVAQQKSASFQQGRLRVLPWIRMSTGAFVINGHDPYFRRAWIMSYRNADGSHYGEVPLTDYPAWTSLLNHTVRLLADCWPEMERDIGEGLRAVLPVRSPSASVHMSCSKDVMSFAVLMSSGTPAMLAEALIHEFGHNMLNALAEFDDIFMEPRRTQEDLYSPWRPDARPVGGVLHAVYVFERVCEFYLRHLRYRPDDELRHRFRLMTIRNLIALDVLAPLTEALGAAGKQLMATLSARIAQQAKHLTQHDWALTRDELMGHYQQWLVANPTIPKPDSSTLRQLLNDSAS